MSSIKHFGYEDVRTCPLGKDQFFRYKFKCKNTDLYEVKIKFAIGPGLYEKCVKKNGEVKLVF